jgi:hypothetical protein
MNVKQRPKEQQPQQIIVASTHETIRTTDPDEEILLVTRGLTTCIAITFEGNGKKSLTHFLNICPSEGSEEKEKDIVPIITKFYEREAEYIGKSCVLKVGIAASGVHPASQEFANSVEEIIKI